jgi:hypothetical protein
MPPVTIATTPPMISDQTAAWLGDNPATDASIAAYNRAGEHMRTLMDAILKAGVVVFVLVAAAWLIGLLPGAARLF